MIPASRAALPRHRNTSLVLASRSLKVQRRLLGTLCVALVATLASTSRADDAENVAAARALGSEGVQLADAGKCPEAIEKLERAESLHHAPTILGRLGECQVNVGDVVLGTENLNKVVRETLPANAPKVFHDAQDRAQKVLLSATPKIAYLTIRITPSDVKASVAIAGRTVPNALIGAERPTDPGTHQVTATAEGYKPSSATVTLAEGGHQDITLLLEKDSNAASALPSAMQPQGASASVVPSPEPAPKKSNPPAYVAFSVGAAGLVVGSASGALAFAKASDCPNKVCETQSVLDSAKSLATISTVSFGVGIAGVAVGTILLLTGNHHETAPILEKARHDPGAAHPTARLSVRPWFAVSSVGLVGSFQ
jgi:hypothetical protein